MTEDVMRQKHYVDLPIQPIMVMLKDLPPAEFRGFLRGNILKYTLRADGKNGVEDEEKALVYAKWLVEFDRTGTITVPGKSNGIDITTQMDDTTCPECFGNMIKLIEISGAVIWECQKCGHREADR
jgi:hypothetical protein